MYVIPYQINAVDFLSDIVKLLIKIVIMKHMIYGSRVNEFKML